MLVTLDDMKEHLRIEQDDTTQDNEIKRALMTAENAVRTHIDDGENGESVFSSSDDALVEKGKCVIMMLAADLFENRESETVGTMVETKAFKMLIDQLKNY
jgi:uncharacterized phage protein (predicted DNA packaging)